MNLQDEVDATLPVTDSERLKSDIKTNESKCGKVMLIGKSPAGLVYDSLDDERRQFESCNIHYFQLAQMDGLDAYWIRVHLIDPIVPTGGKKPVIDLYYEYTRENESTFRKQLGASKNKCAKAI